MIFASDLFHTCFSSQSKEMKDLSKGQGKKGTIIISK